MFKFKKNNANFRIHTLKMVDTGEYARLLVKDTPLHKLTLPTWHVLVVICVCVCVCV